MIKSVLTCFVIYYIWKAGVNCFKSPVSVATFVRLETRRSLAFRLDETPNSDGFKSIRWAENSLIGYGLFSSRKRL